MANTLKSMSNSPTCSAIAAAIESDPLARDILCFLSANENAMDTASGIAAWWLHNDEVAVQPSLHSLVLCGAIIAHTLRSGTTLYGLTQDFEVRAGLRSTLRGPGDRSSSAKGPMSPTHSVTSVSKP